MFALSRLLRERASSSSLAAGALLACALSNAPSAQCGDEVVMKVLDAGTSSPILITPKGAPVIGGDFSFRVFDAPPMGMGFLIYSAFEDAMFDPMFGATIYPTPPLFSKSFGTNIQGKSGPLFNASVVTDDICGAFATFQAIVADAGAPGGFVVTNAVRLRVGSVTRSPLAYDALATDGTEEASALALGDMDEDGIRDLVSLSRPDDSMAWVRPGLASGGFDAALKTAVATFSTTDYLVDQIELADVNGDGHLDLVRKGDSAVAFAYGNGAGGFLGESMTSVPRPISTTHAADLNNDGILDVVVAGEGGAASADGNKVAVLLGTNIGFFSFPVSYPAVVTTSVGVGADVGAADLDEDGDLDLAVATATKSDVGLTSVLAGAGNGTFGSPVSYVDASLQGNAASLGGKRAVRLALADFDGDTIVDVAMTYEANRRLYRRLSNGDLTLGPVAEYTVGNEPHEIAVADVDGDTNVDLITRNTGSGDVSVLAGLGDGSFVPSGTFGLFIASRGMAVDDVDFDGNQDLLVAVDNYGAPGEHQILHVVGNGDGTFAGAHQYLFAAGLVMIADFDGNGVNDVMTGAEDFFFSTTELLLHRYNPDGTFGPAETVSSVEVSSAQAFELTGDVIIDLIVRTSTNMITVLPGLGDGTFGPQLDAFTPDGSFFTLADFDGDHVLDIAATASDPGLDVALGNGDGTFAAPSTHTTTGHPAFGTFAVGDVDGNTTQDLVYMLSSPERISMRPGNGDGTFGPEETLFTGSSLGPPLLVDLGKDGDLDIVFEDFDTFVHYANDGTGTFGLAQTVTLKFQQNHRFADMDGDGDTDVVIGTINWSYLLLWEEPGVLGQPTKVPLGGEIALGDLDRDGMPDVASLTGSSGPVGRLSIRYNQVGE